jgi:hypothetical protein
VYTAGSLAARSTLSTTLCSWSETRRESGASWGDEGKGEQARPEGWGQAA